VGPKFPEGIFSIARGKVAEVILIVIMGDVWFYLESHNQYTKSHILHARLDFIRDKYQIRHNDFLTFDELRQSAQCVGQVIRSKMDYGLVIIADSRYGNQDMACGFPMTFPPT
jgi:DNA excision repair protein ERCC-2